MSHTLSIAFLYNLGQKSTFIIKWVLNNSADAVQQWTSVNFKIVLIQNLHKNSFSTLGKFTKLMVSILIKFNSDCAMPRWAANQSDEDGESGWWNPRTEQTNILKN